MIQVFRALDRLSSISGPGFMAEKTQINKLIPLGIINYFWICLDRAHPLFYYTGWQLQ